jgi:uncharacterized protein GlcG (DUF336 family)
MCPIESSGTSNSYYYLNLTFHSGRNLRNKFAPVAVNVVDQQANVLVQKRMDGVIHVGIPEFSYAKAYTCIVMNLASREFRDKYTGGNDITKVCQMNSMIDISGGKMAAFPGGILLRNIDNEVVGAIGVSGASGDEDEYACLKSVWDSRLPLITQPRNHSCNTLSEDQSTISTS